MVGARVFGCFHFINIETEMYCSGAAQSQILLDLCKDKMLHFTEAISGIKPNTEYVAVSSKNRFILYDWINFVITILQVLNFLL